MDRFIVSAWRGEPVGERLRLMAVHAHPDDESSKGAATMAMYVAEGVDVLVVTCTGGERGSVLNPKLDRPEVWENIAEIRRQEMDRAREILGVRQDWLGFVDSGFPEGDPLPPLPEGCFGLESVERAAEPLVRLMREFRPHVVTTYDEDGGYPHPDHVMCRKISVAAFDASGDQHYGRQSRGKTPLIPTEAHQNLSGHEQEPDHGQIQSAFRSKISDRHDRRGREEEDQRHE